MSEGGNKQVVQRFLDQFERPDIGAILDMLTDDATWWLNGRSDLYSEAGARTKAEMATAWSALFDRLEGGLRMDVSTMIAEGDRVAAEMQARAVTKAGGAYGNGYHMLFTVRGGKIAGVREYTDLLAAAAAFT